MGRGPQDYRRRGPTREPYDLVLIVCEGAKTEPNYFKGFRTAYGLSNANIIITPANHNDPMSIVRFTENRVEEEDYDKAFCVFDRDGHVNYDQALRYAAECPLVIQNRLVVIPSVPCFEIWILLHFVYTSAVFQASGDETACERVLRAVKRHMPQYTKAAGTYLI